MTATKPSVGWYWWRAWSRSWGPRASYAATGDRVDGFARDALPGQVTVPIDAAGTYAVFYEAADTDGVPSLDVGVTGPDGAAVPVRRVWRGPAVGTRRCREPGGCDL